MLFPELMIMKNIKKKMINLIFKLNVFVKDRLRDRIEKTELT